MKYVQNTELPTLLLQGSYLESSSHFVAQRTTKSRVQKRRHAGTTSLAKLIELIKMQKWKIEAHLVLPSFGTFGVAMVVFVWLLVDVGVLGPIQYTLLQAFRGNMADQRFLMSWNLVVVNGACFFCAPNMLRYPHVRM